MHASYCAVCVCIHVSLCVRGVCACIPPFGGSVCAHVSHHSSAYLKGHCSSMLVCLCVCVCVCVCVSPLLSAYLKRHTSCIIVSVCMSVFGRSGVSSLCVISLCESQSVCVCVCLTTLECLFEESLCLCDCGGLLFCQKHVGCRTTVNQTRRTSVRCLAISQIKEKEIHEGKKKSATDLITALTTQFVSEACQSSIGNGLRHSVINQRDQSTTPRNSIKHKRQTERQRLVNQSKKPRPGSCQAHPIKTVWP